MRFPHPFFPFPGPEANDNTRDRILMMVELSIAREKVLQGSEKPAQFQSKRYRKTETGELKQGQTERAICGWLVNNKLLFSSNQGHLRASG